MKKTFTPAEKEAYRQQKDAEVKTMTDAFDGFVTRLIEKTEEVNASGVWKEYLDTMSRFHNYSANNVWWLIWQNPEVTRVAGFNTWKSFGRFVKKGEKALKVLAPVIVKKEDENTGEERSVLVGFKTVSVFDISQTDGAELPAAPDWSSTEKKPELNDAIVKFARTLNVTVTFDATGLRGAKGVSKGGTIQVDPETGTRTLFHEIAHEILHQGFGQRQGLTRQQAELEAESVAYVVSKHFGFEDDDTAAVYLSNWGADAKAIKNTLTTIRNTSAQVINGIEKHLTAADAARLTAEVNEFVNAE